jgi:hypothetical protein
MLFASPSRFFDDKFVSGCMFVLSVGLLTSAKPKSRVIRPCHSLQGTTTDIYFPCLINDLIRPQPRREAGPFLTSSLLYISDDRYVRLALM